MAKTTLVDRSSLATHPTNQGDLCREARSGTELTGRSGCLARPAEDLTQRRPIGTGWSNGRPGRDSVRWPSTSTGSPLTMTVSMPSGNCFGLA
jgi:hypothetical protein